MDIPSRPSRGATMSAEPVDFPIQTSLVLPPSLSTTTFDTDAPSIANHFSFTSHHTLIRSVDRRHGSHLGSPDVRCRRIRVVWKGTRTWKRIALSHDTQGALGRGEIREDTSDDELGCYGSLMGILSHTPRHH